MIEKLFAIVDMGTTNTRLTLIDTSGKVYASEKGEFGVKDCAAAGRKEILINGLNRLLTEVIRHQGLSLSKIERMICSGMITSDIGLIDIPHCTAPIDVNELAAHTIEMSMPEILPAPVIFIPGVKNQVEHPSLESLEEMDFMRGEETQVFGAIELYGIEAPATFMFLSSHTKVIDVDEKYRITRSFTTLSGQIFNALRFHSFLASSIPKENPTCIHMESLFRGVKLGLKNGILRAALMVRFMDILIKTAPEERFSFLEGIIIASDIQAIRNGYPHTRKRIVILGNQLRSEAYSIAFKEYLDPTLEFISLGEESTDRATLHGAMRIAQLRSRFYPTK